MKEHRTICHSERSLFCDSKKDSVKNSLRISRELSTAIIHGILHFANIAIAILAPFRMTRKFKGMLRQANALLAMILILILSSCGSNEVKPTTASLTSSDELPSQTSAHTRMSFSSDGKVRAVMNASGVRVFEQKRHTLLDSSVHVDFFDRDANHSSVLTSHRAFIDDNTHNMTAYDSVRVLSDSGTLVETDSLLWDNNNHKLHSDAFVRITEKSGRITRGHGFESDQDLVNYKILLPIIDAPSSTFENNRNIL